MTIVNKEKVIMNSKEIKHDLCMLFHAIEDEYGTKNLCNLIKECLEILAEYELYKKGKNEEKSKLKIHKKSKLKIHKKPKVKEYEINTDNIEEALKQVEKLNILEEVKKIVMEHLKD